MSRTMVTAVVTDRPMTELPTTEQRASLEILERVSDKHEEVEIISEGYILKFPDTIEKEVKDSIKKLGYFMRVTARYEEKKKKKDDDGDHNNKGSFAYTPECFRVDGG